MAPHITIQSLPGIPLIQAGDDLAAMILEAVARLNLRLQDDDVLVVTSKIVSKSEGRRLDLRTITPSARAEEIAQQTGKDSRLVEVLLGEAAEISRMRPGSIITRHKLGFISANAGIDHSNVGTEGDDWILLLPVDPDASARRLREALFKATGAQVGIVISDTHGRPFRLGNMGTAVGVAGFAALVDLRGQPDLFNRKLQYTDIGFADELAAAADLLSGQANEGLPVTLIRGLRLPPGDGKATDLNRPPETSMFR
ncbi:MAG: coenzyme F420-0:L-glutamate ligase [Anaerolineae bacterium]|nr:coenzyme F420-0:L-glutamate ligase [Anaerolineae bacterium]